MELESDCVKRGLQFYSVRDFDAAFTTFEECASRGDTGAKFYISIMYNEGTSESIDNIKAARLFREAAEYGNILAPIEYSVLLESGTGVEKSVQEAERWTSVALNHLDEINILAEKGNPFAQVILSHIYNSVDSHKDLKESFMWAERAAEQGHLQGINHLAIDYYFGTGVEKNTETAIKLLSAEGNEELPWNATILAYIYLMGETAAQLHDKTIDLLQRAANKNDVSALYYLGYIYDNGMGTAKDEQQAISWFSKVVETENQYDTAYYDLGSIYFNKKSPLHNYNIAMEWFEKGAVRDDPDSQVYLAYGKYHGIGTEKNHESANYWFKEAAAQDEPYALYMLGKMSYEGKTKDINKVRELLKKAIDLGSVEAINFSNSIRWDIKTDSNNDGKITISDINGWFKWIFNAPGDGALYIINNMGSLATFFEIDKEIPYGNWLSIIFSIIVWLFIFFGLSNQ